MAASKAELREERLDERHQHVRVWFQTVDGKDHIDLEDVANIRWADDEIVIAHRWDHDGDRHRRWHFNPDHVIGYKVIDTPREWTDDGE